MTNDDNNALCAFARVWKLDGDWMTCKGCDHHLIASRDGEESRHGDDCKHASEHHPWAQLRAIIAPDIKPVKPKRDDYPADFESAWNAYPPRAGSNKRTAFKAWSARIKAGATVVDMLAGVERYATYVLAERTEERFIKQPATFFGPDDHYALPWASKSAPAARQSVNDEAKRRLFGGFDEFGASDAPR